MPQPIAVPSILFICLGNICRSPLAEGALRHVAARRSLALRLDSAGTGDWHIGHPPDPRARRVAAQHGVDIGDLRARQVTPQDFDQFDLILAADARNLADLAALRPRTARADVALMLDQVPGRAGQAVADPYYGGPDDFAAAWADVMALADALAGRLGRR